MRNKYASYDIRLFSIMHLQHRIYRKIQKYQEIGWKPDKEKAIQQIVGQEVGFNFFDTFSEVVDYKKKHFYIRKSK